MLFQVVLVALSVVLAPIILSNFSVEISLILLVVVLISSEAIIGFVLLKYALYPTDVIARAMIQIMGEDSVLSPLNYNNFIIKTSGAKIILDELYNLSASAKTAEDQIMNYDEKMTNNLLLALPVGLIALDANRNIIATNRLAPVYLSEENTTKIQLDFTDSANSLNEWLDNVEEKSINAEKLWAHIQNLPPDTDGRKVFDVLAHYKKNAQSGIETIIVTIDRTDEYLKNENDMDFIALAAHELRGPITVIRGYLDTLDEQLADQLTDEQHDMIDRLNVSANRLSAYVNNILNASRYDRHHLQLKLHEIDVDEIIDDIEDDMKLRARTLGRHLVFRIPSNLPTVAADRSSISEVMSNLIDNAIKYSHDDGQIIISAAVDGDFVALSVQDFGTGIPPVVAQHLFSKFYRSHRTRGAVNGSGLGLYISRTIVESHGGHISVNSQENEGSTFTFTLPIYSTVAKQLGENNSNKNLIHEGGGWIKNHSMIKK